MMKLTNLLTRKAMLKITDMKHRVTHSSDNA